LIVRHAYNNRGYKSNSANAASMIIRNLHSPS
jgi:hypothetical protein